MTSMNSYHVGPFCKYQGAVEMSTCHLFSKGGAASGSDSSDKKSQGPKGGGNAVKVSY